jgi:hypothetical protein
MAGWVDTGDEIKGLPSPRCTWGNQVLYSCHEQAAKNPRKPGRECPGALVPVTRFKILPACLLLLLIHSSLLL